MAVAIEHEVPSFAWRNVGPGAHVAHAALIYMFNQIEGGVMCPMAMAYSVIPSLQTTPVIGNEWTSTWFAATVSTAPCPRPR